jgi:signal transduction histidine kinase
MIEREQEFTGNASHELRTPLTVIRTSCELLESETGLPEKARARIAAIGAAAERMTGQIEMLLFLARAETAGIKNKVSIASCVNDAAQPLLAEVAAKPVEFQNLVPANTVFTLNRHALDIVITNLLRNAFTYTERGLVSVSLENKSLVVSDTGIGINPAQLPHIFGRFNRGSSHGDGFGLGLAIVQRVCDLHGWIIDVDSTPAKGTTFRLTLP